MEECIPAIKRLGEEVDKALGTFSGRSAVACSEFLRALSVNPINGLIFRTYRGDEWRHRHSPAFMLKATIFMRLKGIKFQAGLVRYLAEHPEDAANLGCKTGRKGKPVLPARRTFNYFIGERLTREVLGLIDFTAAYAREAARERGIMLDLPAAVKPKRQPSDRTVFRKRRDRTKELCRLMRKEIYPKVQLGLAGNARYAQADFLDMLSHVALTHDFTENGSRTFALGGRISPSADALLYHVKKYRHRREVELAFKGVFGATLAMARSAGLLARPVDAAIDMTDIPYYGDRDDYMVLGTKPRRGTNRAFRFASMSIVVSGERFMVCAVPVALGTPKEETVRRLVSFARANGVHVRHLLLDRGFSSTSVFGYLNREGIRFIMPAVRTWRVQRVIKACGAPYSTDFRMKEDLGTSHAWFRLVLVKGGKRGDPNQVYAFATNIPAAGGDFLTAVYDLRWGIETAYRVKEAFRARTTSKDYVVRLFYFLFSLALYNLWILVNSMLSLCIFGRPAEKPLVTAKLFGVMLYTADCG